MFLSPSQPREISAMHTPSFRLNFHAVWHTNYFRAHQTPDSSRLREDLERESDLQSYEEHALKCREPRTILEQQI